MGDYSTLSPMKTSLLPNKTLPTAALILWLFPQVAQATTELRAAFKQAHAQISVGKARISQYGQLKAYPLYPYLLAAELRHDLRQRPGGATDQRMRDFLSAYGQQPATQAVRMAWLETLAKRGAWADFLNYLPARQDEKTQCRAALAKIKLNRSDKVATASDLWLYGKLRDEACVPVFQWLGDSGSLTPALIEGRLNLAREAGEAKVVSYLSRKATGKARRQAELWLAGHASPANFMRAYVNGGHRDLDQTTLVQIFQRLGRLSPDTAAGLHAGVAKRAGLDNQTRGELAAWIGYRKILNRHPDALTWYQRAGDARLDDLHRLWRLRSAVRVQDWQAIRDITSRMTAEEAEHSRWRYWRARALEQLGDKQAKGLYETLAVERSFYGFMAADRINQPYSIQDRPAVVDKALQQRLGQRGEVQRARELFAVGMRSQGRDEWRVLLADTTAEEQRQAALMALAWGWHSQSALAMGRAKYWDDMATRFPVIYLEQVQAAAQRERIPAGWIYGIMRSESLFTPDIRSYAGAVGLMQLMPGTGKLVAGKLGLGWRGTDGLEDPDYNIRLGSRYLRMMLDKFGQHTALATASYNAGPGNALRWLGDTRLPADVWIETVPFNATHDYLLHVLEYTAVYHWRMTGKPLSLKQLLPDVPARREVD